jgi:hypothetical protein
MWFAAQRDPSDGAHNVCAGLKTQRYQQLPIRDSNRTQRRAKGKTVPTLQENPFTTYLHPKSIRSYHGLHKGRLRKLFPHDTSPDPAASFVHDMFRTLILDIHYPCVAARSAIHRGNYRIGFYPRLAGEDTTPALASDLSDFVSEFPIHKNRFATFVAAFDEPAATSEEEFEQLLWRQLQQLHDLDVRHHAWDPSVSADPQDPKFSFSFAARSFFVVGLHPSASRTARKFTWPTLVFNAHAQFEALRDSGVMPRMQTTIRNRDIRLQGSINPMLSEYGASSEALQYSGRHVEEGWSCPLKVRGQADPYQGTHG